MKHGSITHEGAAPDFFEGALLGNGGLGAVVTTRPDAVAIHFGHNEVWDIRVEEGHAPGIGTFAEVFAKVAAIDPTLDDLTDDPWFARYNDLVRASYDLPFPRPFPCGSLILGFDPRRVEVLGHRLDLATATCTISLLADGTPVEAEVFVAREDDRLWVSQAGAAVFDRIKLLPDPVGLIPDPRTGATGPGPEVLPAPGLAVRQVLPALDPAVESNAFVLTATTNAVLQEGSRRGVDGKLHSDGALERTLADSADLRVAVTLKHGVAYEAVAAGVVELADYAVDRERTTRFWSSYWQASAVELADEFLTELWYRNSYFLACASGPGKTCPGLFGPWSYRRIGSDWHGDYHLNYNVQQPFWGVFSSNHPELHERYVSMVEHLLPISRDWAGRYYGLRGAAFPHSAYPVPMATNPYPDPSWGWEVCETPWAVQSLWWHYVYTQDLDYLRDRAFGPLKEATLFFVDYVLSSSDRGAFEDGKLHVFPTVTPELYGLRPGFRYNADCVVDLALGRFLLDAFTEAARVLERSDEEAELLTQVREVLRGLVDYPLAESRDGQVVVSTPGEDPAIVYNVPVAAVPAFPAEQVGLGSDPADLELLRRTWRNQTIEGGNELVFAALQAARLGILDLERFKRDVRYCLLPNGTATDRVRAVHGRYDDTTSFDFMSRGGIWVENFALPGVINECLLQSYDGVLRFFPNWPREVDACFTTLRAAGAFLVSATLRDGQIEEIRILSETGSDLSVDLPWPGGAVDETTSRQLPAGIIRLPTAPGQTVVLHPLSS
ncbi:glycoside hydrolase N-terminal domain-containing protein [Kribbella qitaiheensis]|uniref:glycosyl hydrolase family 95 catalytic domain-containing protein n=1 Tax=Kribbella qitaiheensis TaxID=1544730 RepID=UPI00360E637D